MANMIKARGEVKCRIVGFDSVTKREFGAQEVVTLPIASLASSKYEMMIRAEIGWLFFHYPLEDWEALFMAIIVVLEEAFPELFPPE